MNKLQEKHKERQETVELVLNTINELLIKNNLSLGIHKSKQTIVIVDHELNNVYSFSSYCV